MQDCSLFRETEDEIEVDMANAMPAEIFDGSGRLHLTLDPIDRLLHIGIKALHADARAVDTGSCQGFGHFRCERSGIDLHGDRSSFAESEVAA